MIFNRLIFHRVCVHIIVGVHQGQRCQIPLELELQAAGSCQVWVLGTERESSARAVHVHGY